MVDAKITQIQSKAAKRNSNGEITQEPYASITLNIPLDSAEQRKNVLHYLELLRDEWVVLDINEKQEKLDSMSGVGSIPKEDQEKHPELFGKE